MADRVTHFELPADNVERAQTFYREAFGWSINAGTGYTLLGTTPTDKTGAPTEPGAINGGMLSRQAPITSPVITIEVKNIDESIGKIERLGGRVVRGKQPVAQIGFAAYFADSEGNVLGLWQSAG
ncbi:MAG TPA: VOC family protein [Candidatus Acidoferrum sp.]|nr:VOC family protein [Candidatus Acidoferrum sp.]